MNIAIGLMTIACALAAVCMIGTIVLCIKTREEIPVVFVAVMGAVFFFEGTLVLGLCGATALEVVASFAGGVLCTIIAIIGFIREMKPTSCK